MATLIKTDKNGTKYYRGLITCDRCNGVGIFFIGVCNGQPVPSHVDSGICFKCGGAGKVESTWKEYTPEHEAKLAEQRRRRAEKRKAEEAKRLAEAEAKRQQEEAERIAREEAIKAEKAKSEHFGKIGDKIEVEATYIGSASFERQAYRGWGTETAYIHRFKIGDNVAVWCTTSVLGHWEESAWESLEEGATVTLKGTIKEHNEYRDEKQTVLTRCRIK